MTFTTRIEEECRLPCQYLSICTLRSWFQVHVCQVFQYAWYWLVCPRGDLKLTIVIQSSIGNQNRGRMSLTLSVSIYLYFAVLVNPHNIRDLLHMGGRRGVDPFFLYSGCKCHSGSPSPRMPSISIRLVLAGLSKGRLVSKLSAWAFLRAHEMSDAN
jgi:hypothetical protein